MNIQDKKDLLRRYLTRISPANTLESLGDDDGALECIDKANATDREKQHAVNGLQRLKNREDFTAEEMFSLEAIILPGKRPAVDVIGDTFTMPNKLFPHFGKGKIKKRIEAALPSIGRIELPNHPKLPYGGTGFVVGQNLLMTNRHVAEIFATGLGNEGLLFRSGHTAGIDFKKENNGGSTSYFRVAKILMIHPYWDMALLVTEGLNSHHKPLTLSVQHPGDMAGREVAVIGYPAPDDRNDLAVQNRVFRDLFYVKRMQPGKLGPRARIESFGHFVDSITHDSSTLGGNSGSAAIDVETGHVVGLHFMGLYLKTNYAVPTRELALDARVADAGVNFEAKIASGATSWEEYWNEARGLDSPERPSGKSILFNAPGSAATWTIPFEITVRVGEGAGGTALLSANGDKMERRPLAKPSKEKNYDNRRGYQDDFLGPRVPLPALKDSSVVSTLDDGSHNIPYKHFSVVMHRDRRLALFVASNVMADTAINPETRKPYIRAELGSESWFTDSRIPAKHQIPEWFYDKDDKAFDKGHIVGRDYLAWGSTLDELQLSNGDSFHVTNCSPQTMGFNRFKGEWRHLESFVQRQVKAERLSVFAGPVLADADRVFVGEDRDGELRIQIPSRFWKIVVARKGDRLQSFGFILEQDLSKTPLEFMVDAVWKHKMISIPALEKIVRFFKFPKEMHKSDQWAAAPGESIRIAANLERFAGK